MKKVGINGAFPLLPGIQARAWALCLFSGLPTLTWMGILLCKFFFCIDISLATKCLSDTFVVGEQLAACPRVDFPKGKWRREKIEWSLSKKHMLDRRWSNCIYLLRFHPKYCKSVSVFRCKLQLSLNLQTLLQRRSLVFFLSIFLMKKCISWLITEHWCHPRVHYCNWTREKGQAVKKIESSSWCPSPSGFSILMIQVH